MSGIDSWEVKNALYHQSTAQHRKHIGDQNNFLGIQATSGSINSWQIPQTKMVTIGTQLRIISKMHKGCLANEIMGGGDHLTTESLKATTGVKEEKYIPGITGIQTTVYAEETAIGVIGRRPAKTW